MSSRNRYLSVTERALAPFIHATLRAAASRVASGERDYLALAAWGAAQLQAAGMAPDYFEIRNADTLLAPLQATQELVILTAARLGKARLIDNLRVRPG
jgi:pantoate--beta-alanine ligase